MNLITILVPAMLAVLPAGSALCFTFFKTRHILAIPVFSSGAAFILSIVLLISIGIKNTHYLYNANLIIDPLALYHILLINIIFFVTSIYAGGYFSHSSQTPQYLRRYTALWQIFQAFLLIVILSNNIGIMWVALEMTTIVSAFLIISESSPLSLEAMWKYLLVCSVGIAFAFIGTILTIAAAGQIPAIDSPFLFSQLHAHASLIEPRMMLFAFIFIVAGFGTKAGLSPMHTWLPDAHSQAPTPVSAVFSGVMLNCALYCIMRYMPITEAAMGGNGQAHSILILFGFLSLIFSAVFIPVQHDIKRLLAYCSVEHMGIIAIGLGIGGLGTFAAMLHTANHSLSKVLAFLSAGHIGNSYGTRDMRKITSAVHNMPLWGTAFLLSMLVLTGVAPFSVFMSEFFIVKEAFFQGKYIIVALFLFCALLIFMSILKQILNVSFGEHSSINPISKKSILVDGAIVVVFMAALLLLGIWIPAPFGDFLHNAASAVENGIGL